MEHINTSFVVSVDFSAEDKGVLIVGVKDHKAPSGMKVLNAFQGEEAWWLYNKLIKQKGNLK